MTITANESREEYTANPGQTVFIYGFKIYDGLTDLTVTIDCIETSAYTVTGVGDEDGGNVILNDPLAGGELVTIVSSIPENRETDYQQNGDFLPQTVNNDLDRLLSITKQVSDRTNRAAFLFPECDQGVKPRIFSPDPNSFLGYDENGNPVSLTPPFAIEGEWVVFSTVADMKMYDLAVGSGAQTQGYYSAGDGGGATYLIAATQTVDTYGDHEIGNGNVALIQAVSSLLQYGAIGDGATDSTLAIQAAFDADGESLTGNDLAFAVDPLTLANKTIDHATFRSDTLNAVATITLDTAQLVNCVVENSGWDGINIASGDCAVIHCIVRNGAANDRFGIRDSSNGNTVIDQSVVHGWSGSAIYIDGMLIPDPTGKKSIFSNTVYDITHNSGTGQYGNGIHAWESSDLLIENNNVYNTSYSSIRTARCKDTIIRGNIVTQVPWVTATGDMNGIYVEFEYNNVVVTANLLRNARLVMANAVSDGGRSSHIADNVITNNIIEMESYGNITNNILTFDDDLDDPRTFEAAIYLGLAATSTEMVCANNNISDNQTSKLACGIACLAVDDSVAPIPDARRSVIVSDNSVVGPDVDVAGHYLYTVRVTNGLEPVPNYVRYSQLTVSSEGGFSYGGAGQTERHVLCGKLSRLDGYAEKLGGPLAARNKYNIEVYESSWASNADTKTEYLVSHTKDGAPNSGFKAFNSFGVPANHTLSMYSDASFYYVIITFSGFYVGGVQSKFVGSNVGNDIGFFGNFGSLFPCQSVSQSFLDGLTDSTVEFVDYS